MNEIKREWKFAKLASSLPAVAIKTEIYKILQVLARIVQFKQVAINPTTQPLLCRGKVVPRPGFGNGLGANLHRHRDDIWKLAERAGGAPICNFFIAFVLTAGQQTRRDTHQAWLFLFILAPLTRMARLAFSGPKIGNLAFFYRLASKFLRIY